jgi:transglutaminase-like putative cysteine protease
MTPIAIIAALLLLASPERSPPSAVCRPNASILDVRRPAQPEWFGLYLMNRKAGWLQTSVTRESRSGKQVLVSRQEMLIEAKVGARSVRRSQRDEKVYEARPGGRLVSYSSSRAGDGGDRRLQLDCGPKACKATLTADDGPRVLDVPLPPETAEQADAARLAAARCGVVEGVQLQAEDLRERKMRDRFAERKTLGSAGVTFSVAVVDELEEGDRLAARVLVADDGRVVEFRYGDALVAKPEPEEIARKLDEIDLFNMSRIPLPAALPRGVPAEIAYSVRGLPEAFQVDDPRQRFSKGTDGETIVTVAARRPSADDFAKDVQRKVPDAKGNEDLRATPEIDWDHPAVRKLSEKIAAEGTSRASSGTWATARRISRTVHDRLEKVYGQSRDRASEVLRSGKGDCTEHALLFVALARAAGIPARGVHGLVYANYGDGGPGLYWHAWAEVRVGDEWIAIDPTFDQDVADATHIALGRGTKVDAVGLIGSLSVTRADVRK